MPTRIRLAKPPAPPSDPASSTSSPPRRRVFEVSDRPGVLLCAGRDVGEQRQDLWSAEGAEPHLGCQAVPVHVHLAERRAGPEKDQGGIEVRLRGFT